MSEIITVICLIVAIYLIYIWLSGKDPESILRREINRLREVNKSARFILYLRSFASETLKFSDIKYSFYGNTIPGTSCYWKNVGDTVTDFLRVIGDVVALERPEHTLGIKPWAPSHPKQVSVENDQWQRKIVELIPKAALVVVQVDLSAGLVWEMQQLTHLLSPSKILFVLPPSQAEYDEIREGISGIFLESLPVQLPLSRLLTFRPDWHPLPLIFEEGSIYNMWRSLEPVFQQNGYESPFKGYK
jgi:hypothetical protein